MKPQEIVEVSKGMSIERLKMKTVKRHISALSRLFSHLKNQGAYEGDNPASGFEFPDKRRDNEKRQMWEGDKLTKLFASPVWTGCFSAHRRSRPGAQIIKDERYWLPVLGLYHDNRLEEFAQLRLSDFRNENGITYFAIHDEGDRQIKNPQSARRVPLHPDVKALGFLDYVATLSNAQEGLVFPKLRPGGSDKKLGYYFTKWWTSYRQSVGVYEEVLDYQSFRHGVITKLYGADVSEATIRELVGHEGVGTAQKVYKKPSGIETLYNAISKVQWLEVAL